MCSVFASFFISLCQICKLSNYYKAFIILKHQKIDNKETNGYDGIQTIEHAAKIGLGNRKYI